MTPATKKVMFSSGNDEWRTPRWLFDALNRRYTYTLDVAATAANALCKRYYTQKSNALVQSWAADWWCNPPYSRKLLPMFVDKALAEMAHGESRGTFLVPARTETEWFWNLWRHAREVIFIKGRLSFLYPDGSEGTSAPFPSVVLHVDRDIYNPSTRRVQLLNHEQIKNGWF